MPHFDVSKEWIVLIPPGIPAAKKAGEELSLALGLLRKQARVSMDPPLLGVSPSSRNEPSILLGAGPEKKKLNGFSWRLGTDKLEIYGASGRGLCNGIFDFLAALGMRWPRPGRDGLKAKADPQPVLPAMDQVRPWDYTLKETKGLRQSDSDISKRRRLFLNGALPPKAAENWIIWAARNRIDGIVFPLTGAESPLDRLTGRSNRPRDSLYALAEDYALIVEAGGWALSGLLPRRYFLSKPESFRMEQGKRIKKINFCATNPDTLRIVKTEAERIFRELPGTEVFHLWPDRGNEKTWCACPSCRAFSPEEQNRIAVNCAADVLGELNPDVRISWHETGDEEIDIRPRENMFKLTKFPGEEGAETEGLFLT
jgi:hypothetical protein